ncbi:hypothetical protein SAMN05421507_13116 [Lentzea jiangxiensis]|uniref:Uncharacterized protein n=1 Tax=Lentzea jiangxiensis TaxID=641025 RepID=A0A1H0X3F2_9PSEU|nr:hypothetical protein SAMN05421507_13116 [Lentzea jiangxiensis]
MSDDRQRTAATASWMSPRFPSMSHTVGETPCPSVIRWCFEPVPARLIAGFSNG